MANNRKAVVDYENWETWNSEITNLLLREITYRGKATKPVISTFHLISFCAEIFGRGRLREDGGVGILSPNGWLFAVLIGSPSVEPSNAALSQSYPVMRVELLAIALCDSWKNCLWVNKVKMNCFLFRFLNWHLVLPFWFYSSTERLFHLFLSTGALLFSNHSFGSAGVIFGW